MGYPWVGCRVVKNRTFSIDSKPVPDTSRFLTAENHSECHRKLVSNMIHLVVHAIYYGDTYATNKNCQSDNPIGSTMQSQKTNISMALDLITSGIAILIV